MSEAARLHEAITPADLADRMGCSERLVRKMARDLGACRIFGKSMVLLPQDVDTILEAARPCPSSSIDAVKSGTIGGPLPDTSYEALVALRTKQRRDDSQPRKKRGRGEAISMDRRRY